MLQIIEHNPDNDKQIAIRNNEMQLAALSDIAENRDEALSEYSNHSHTLSITNSYKSDLNG